MKGLRPIRIQRFQPTRPTNDAVGTFLKECFERLIIFVRFASHGFVHFCVGQSLGEAGLIAASCKCTGVGFETVGWSASEDCS